MKNLNFNEVSKKHLEKLEQYVPVVERVHGKSHPEFYDVKKHFDIINQKIKELDNADLNSEFAILREITNNYTVPTDVCESYEEVYKMLEELDKAYLG